MLIVHLVRKTQFVLTWNFRIQMELKRFSSCMRVNMYYIHIHVRVNPFIRLYEQMNEMSVTIIRLPDFANTNTSTKPQDYMESCCVSLVIHGRRYVSTVEDKI